MQLSESLPRQISVGHYFLFPSRAIGFVNYRKAENLNMWFGVEMIVVATQHFQK
jgi:hypothetical protein